MVEGRKFDFPKGSIVAFDKGYVDYHWFKLLTDKGAFFVTRLRAKAVYRVEERRYADNNQGVLSDQIIQLSSAHAIKRGAPTLRRIGYRDATTGKFYEFLTNNFHLQGSLAGGIVLQSDQTKPENQSVCGHLKKCGVDANLDCHDYVSIAGICASQCKIRLDGAANHAGDSIEFI